MAATFLAVLLVSACAPEAPSSSSSRGYLVFAPSATSAGNTLSNDKVSFAGSPSGTPKNRLVVLFAGTTATPLSLTDLGDALIADGYHVLGLSYSNSVGTMSACPGSVRDTDPDCHRAFRGEVTYGQGLPDPNGVGHDHASVNVTAANSVMGSLVSHLEYAHSRMPDRGWDQFSQVTDGVCVAESATYSGCEPRWDSISLLGYSQGAGVALYLAKFHALAAVGLLSGPFDAFSPSATPLLAPWIAEGDFATPTDRISMLSHTLESERWRYRAVADGLGLAGEPVNIVGSTPPYDGSARLVSNAEPLCAIWNPQAYHNATAVNACADPAIYRHAWRHMVD